MSLQQIADALKAAVAEPHLRLDANGKLADLEALFTIENVARAGQAQALADAETADVTVELCGRPVRSWLIEEQLLDPAEASRRMRLVRGLPDAPATFAAWKADRITGAHALLILKVLPHITDPEPRSLVEAALVEESSWRPPYVVARMVEEILTTLGVEIGRDAHDRRFAERGVGVDATFGGAGSLNGTLTPAVREKLEAALDAAAEPAGQEDTRSRRQRLHDALGEVCDFYLAHAQNLSPVCGERPRVIVTIPLELLESRASEDWATLPSGMRIAPDTARRLACDAGLVPAVLGTTSEVLDIGRTTRTFPLGIRRAAWVRDGGRCAFPSCTRPVVELHHIVHWAQGGFTSLDNASWLCTFHHWLVHEGGWTLRRHADGRYVWTSPDGREHSLPPPRRPRAA
jgi:hypothetical protein